VDERRVRVLEHLVVIHRARLALDDPKIADRKAPRRLLRRGAEGRPNPAKRPKLQSLQAGDALETRSSCRVEQRLDKVPSAAIAVEGRLLAHSAACSSPRNGLALPGVVSNLALKPNPRPGSSLAAPTLRFFGLQSLDPKVRAKPTRQPARARGPRSSCRQRQPKRNAICSPPSFLRYPGQAGAIDLGARAGRAGRCCSLTRARLVGASWCEPCQHFHRAVDAGANGTLNGLRFLEFDSRPRRRRPQSRRLPVPVHPGARAPRSRRPQPRTHDLGLHQGPASRTRKPSPRLQALLAGKRRLSPLGARSRPLPSQNFLLMVTRRAHDVAAFGVATQRIVTLRSASARCWGRGGRRPTLGTPRRPQREARGRRARTCRPHGGTQTQIHVRFNMDFSIVKRLVGVDLRCVDDRRCCPGRACAEDIERRDSTCPVRPGSVNTPSVLELWSMTACSTRARQPRARALRSTDAAST